MGGEAGGAVRGWGGGGSTHHLAGLLNINPCHYIDYNFKKLFLFLVPYNVRYYNQLTVSLVYFIAVLPNIYM